MLPLQRQSDIRRFGTFEVDLRARELRKGGIRIRLQDQPFEILAMILDRPGEIVTRDELRQRLWPAGTFVDFEHSLNAAVKRLRAALGDEADNPRFVETLHRRGYRFIAPVDAESPARRLHSPAVRPVQTPLHEVVSFRLVVLPFANLSGDPTQEYFSDGMTEEMITQISRLSPGLGVIARTSSMLFKRSGKSASEIGRELAVDYLLEGSVRRDGDRIRITAQLIEARSELHLWAETYDRKLEETLILQAEVAARIAQSLAMELVPGRREAIERVRVPQSEAYQAYLKGQFHWNRTGDSGLDSAITYYERALELDSGFAAAHASMARAQVALADFSREPGRPALERARAAARRALELDPGLSDAHVVLGEVDRALAWNWTAAEAHYRAAISLGPSNCAHRTYGYFLSSLSRHDEARQEAVRAADVDPMCLAANTCGAWVSYAAGRYQDAIEQCLHTLDMDSSYALARRLLGAAYVATGRHREGIAELETLVAVRTDLPHGEDFVALAWLAHAKAAAGRTQEAEASVRRLNGEAKSHYVPPYHVALAYCALDDREAAFAHLSQAREERDPALTSIAVEPRFEPVRRDPRYVALIRDLGLAR
jgi:TolB-like protein